MAAGWSISPRTGVTDKGNGEYEIESPLNEPITYTITYTNSDGKSGSAQYTVNPGDCVVCNCDVITDLNTKDRISNSGFTGTLATFNVSNEYCKNTYPISVGNGVNVDNLRIEGNSVVGNVSENYGSSRQIEFDFFFNNEKCDGYHVSIYQSDGCDCGQIRYNFVAETADSSSQTITLVRYNIENGCEDKVRAIAKSYGIEDINVNNGIITCNLPENRGTSSITYRYEIYYGEDTTPCKEYSITQSCSCGCEIIGDDSISSNGGEATFTANLN